MYLLYLDDAGSPSNAADEFFVLAGVCAFERQLHWLAADLDAIVERQFPGSGNSVEIHASRIRTGERRWRGVPRDAREQFLTDVASAVPRADPRRVRLFGAAINKAMAAGEDPVLLAYEQVVSRFDQFLGRLHRTGDTQRGLVIFDKSTYDSELQRVTAQYRDEGHRWGQLRNVAEAPLFLDSKASRLVQLADVVAYGTYRHFERGDSRLFDIVEPHFDREGGVRHGLFSNADPRTLP